jgi:PKD repeat protein
MKARFSTFCSVCLVVLSINLFAARVSQEIAAKTGKNYYWENATGSRQLSYEEIGLELFQTIFIEDQAVYYIFNVNENDGFIIISADDCVLPVIGYSTKGRFTGQNVPKPLSILLNAHAETIFMGINDQIKPLKEVMDEWLKYAEFNPEPPRSKSVAPLLTTVWDQGCAFNAHCPSISYFDACDHAWAGCAAAAMAQLMKYHAYPTTGVGYKYHQDDFPNGSSNQITHYVDFSNTTYQYANMPNTLTIFDSTQFHIAQLMYHCGVAAEMDYDTTESISYMENILAGLKNHFNYSGSAKWEWMTDSAGWKNTIKNELDQSRPVFYFGADIYDNGHFWICDGYDANDRFHMNWAVFDYNANNVPTHYNGYFYLSNLLAKPGGPNFSYRQAAILDLTPSSYCAAWSNSPNWSVIKQVKFNEIDNLQTKNIPWNSYANYVTEHSTDVSQYASHQITVIVRYMPTHTGTLAYCWVDWNQDGTFHNNESLALTWVKDSTWWSGGQPPRTFGIFQGSITVPANASLGNTVLRIRVVDINCGQASPCGASNYGEVEDYGINVLFGTPPPPTAVFSPTQAAVYPGDLVLFTNQSIVNWNTAVSASWTFEGGQPPTWNQWSPPPIAYNMPGSYEVKLIVIDGNGSDTLTGKLNVVPPHWMNVQTPLFHHINLTFTNTPTVNGKNIKAGDLIGVFYQSGSKADMCGGHVIWDGTQLMTLFAYGDDPATPDFKEGFSEGEELRWKALTWDDEMEYDISVEYDHSFPNFDGKFQDNGHSSVTGFLNPQNQLITISGGWSGISIWLNPENPAVEEMFAAISDELIILMNMDEVYWPAQNFNSIGNWNVEQGYKIKVLEDVELSITGARISNQMLNLSQGWNIIPVLSEFAVNAQDVFTSPEIKIAKEIGNNKVFWPEMSIFTLNVLQPGNAYLIYLTEPATIFFPAKSNGEIYEVLEEEILNSPWNNVNKTGDSHVIAISDAMAANFDKGDLVAAFNSKGTLTGITTISKSGNVLVVYGNDPYSSEIDGMLEGEEIFFKVYKQKADEVLEIVAGFDPAMPDNAGYFVPDGISAIDMMTGIEEPETDIQFDVYPNPASDKIHIRFSNENAETTVIEMMNLMGGEVCKPIIATRSEATIHLSHLPEGCYLLKITNGNSSHVKKVIVK